MGIRRRFSSLSGNTGGGPSTPHQATSRTKGGAPSSASKSTTKSTPALLAQSAADENGNLGGNELATTPREAFDLAANLEAFKQRCKALEAENKRLMANQGNIIQESNRRLQVHLEEIGQLKEGMERQKRDNAELVRWAQTMKGDCAKAKELAKEWQKVGQFNNGVVQRELHTFQCRVDQLELKCAKLMGENVELKRLCLYLDKQRQTLWQQLAAKNEGNPEEEEEGGGRENSDEDGREEEEECCCSEDAGCGSSAAPSSPSSSSSNSVDSLQRGRRGEGKMEEAKRGGGGGGGRRGDLVEIDGEQEKTLQSICSEMQSSILLGQLEANAMDDEQQRRKEEGGGKLRQIVSPKILDGEPFEQATIKRMPILEECALMNNSALSENSVRANMSSSSSASSSSLGTTAQFGSSFCSSSDDTAILVLDMDDQSSSAILHPFDSTVATHLVGLEVRELCTISEEEGDEGEGDGAKLVKEQLDRLKLLDGKPRDGGEQQDEMKEFGEEEVVRRRMGGGGIGTTTATTTSSSLSSSLLAQAGSMLASMVDDGGHGQQQQMSRSAFLEDEKVEAANNRNSSASTGSSSSSGAFSGTSGSSGEGIGRGTEMGDGDDDLPPKMPLISENHHRLLLPPTIVGRPSSCLGHANPIPLQPIPHQSSTLPRAAGNLPLNTTTQKRPSSVIGQSARPNHPPEYSSLNSRISPRPQRKIMLMVNGKQQLMGSQSKGPPVRIRVRPPLIAQTNLHQIPPSRAHNNPKNNANFTSLDRPQPLPLHLSTSKVKKGSADVTAL